MGRLKNRPWDEWQTILDAGGHRAYRTLQERIQWDREIIDDTYGKAMSARYRGALDEAERMLDLGYRFLEEVADERGQLLDQLGQYTRMITSFLPAPPIRPRRLRLASLTTVAGLGLVGHHLLVTTRRTDPASAPRHPVGFQGHPAGRAPPSPGPPSGPTRTAPGRGSMPGGRTSTRCPPNRSRAFVCCCSHSRRTASAAWHSSGSRRALVSRVLESPWRTSRASIASAASWFRSRFLSLPRRPSADRRQGARTGWWSGRACAPASRR